MTPPARVAHHQADDDSPAVEVEGQAVNDAAAQVEATPVTCTACGAVHDGRGSTSVEQVEPLSESPWRASCWHCRWYQDEHYPEDAEGEADAHQCPACPACGHQGPAWAPGTPAAR
ncbi:MAG TPA: hypothetical protein VFZ68_18290 [Acidimicrobiales bacterium]